jgi:hypothetical protein
MEITRLTSQLSSLRSLSSNSSAGSTSSSIRFALPGEILEPKHYCWSCGYRYTHYSSRCPVPKPGHQKSAKAADIMGGSTANKPP